MKILRIVLVVLVLQALFFPAIAQDIVVTGKVSGKTGEPLIGATVSVKGTNEAATTDHSGNFTIHVPNRKALLVISYVGMANKELSIPENGTLSVQLDEVGAVGLDEVVVIGYGTQTKKVVTGAISSVKAKDLENVPSNRIEQTLQGRVAGVTIAQNNGQPGSASTIRVRGMTTFGEGGNNPLWVVDNVVVDQGGIGYLNQSDIESIEVLKDAASAAIYGTRAATGVILVTTKKGKSGKLSVNYNGFYGISRANKKLDLLNATQYATIINEKSVNGGGANVFADPAALGAGTDWQDAIFNDKASRFSHEMSLSGGNERSTFYLSFGYQDQEGIVAGPISNYTRKNLRINSTHKFLDIFTFGENVGYSHQKSVGLGNTNSEFGGPLSSAINLDPITPLVITDPAIANANPYSNNPVIKDPNGNPYGISSLVGQEMSNPAAYIQTKLGQYGWSDDFVGSTYLEAALGKHIKLRSSLGGKLSYWGGQGFTPYYYLSATVKTSQNNFNKSNNNSLNWNVENTLTYTNSIDKHNFTVLLGQGSYVENIGGGSSVTLFNLPITSYKDASFNFDIPQANRNSTSSDLTQHKLSSLFTRVNYNYDEKYLFTGILRRDGSSRFGLNHKYGVFPSFSLGWNVSNEAFWPGNQVVDRLKLRGGYGVVGNDAIRDFGYLSVVSGGFNYTLGNADNITTGYAPQSLDNPDLRWEETSQTNIGLEAQLIKSLTLNVDYFIKKTSGILRPVTIPGYVGVSTSPVANIADMENRGIDVELGYHKSFGDFNLGVNANFSYLKNKVTYVASDADFITGDASFQTMGAITRTQKGQSYNSFFGFQTAGIFQNQAEIDAYKNKNGDLMQPKAKPGDFKWVDINGDGKITNDNLDKTFLGSSIPKYTYGFTVNGSYKDFDLMVFVQGTAGSKIFQGLRRLDIGNANYQTKVLGRWTGEGSTNDYPRLTTKDDNGNFTNMSNFYLESGSYARVKLVQLGYTLPSKLVNRIKASRLRFYLTSENLFTITKYTGYDPEIGGAVLGVDRGVYPQARSFIGGVQLQF
ncbi:SusC/RagA family TonB-linked outer membrane protein [Niastella vici]|uniref:SusC/RagA family TonB-linked outer membrane protein n=1 Tax=Niastella vici TaxID=1703345 RepID=A0A1V9FXJ2_9BACT|nr:TonB-dependent receptor [Niastella vici]OQP63089.1 SusC/RagA family TonB-linked outer membrane protein [Niastella vici]